MNSFYGFVVLFNMRVLNMNLKVLAIRECQDTKLTIANISTSFAHSICSNECPQIFTQVIALVFMESVPVFEVSVTFTTPDIMFIVNGLYWITGCKCNCGRFACVW